MLRTSTPAKNFLSQCGCGDGGVMRVGIMDIVDISGMDTDVCAHCRPMLVDLVDL